MSTVAIVVGADDFGMHPRIDAGILALAAMGRVSAISCMVGAPCWGEGLPRLRALDAEKVDVGLHLDLTEYPLDAGLRRSLGHWIVLTHTRSRPAPGLREEIAAQLDSFANGVGAPPAFVDGHEHVHQFPGVRQLLAEELERRGWTPWLRSTRKAEGVHSFKASAIEHLGSAGLAKLTARHGFAQNRCFAGVYGLDARSSGDYLRRLHAWLAGMRTGDLLVCHPAEGWDGAAPFPVSRSHEFAALASAGFATMLGEFGMRIATLRDATTASG
ncbi:ChbG/HpnK family deacetylase [Caenimonas aquaedulcis]|uniref:ChbG/HpnK family deacetylase n=1 Tax=Caenimonas aquaedulcis TaxID=2793270 RepID=A0A931MIJ8_9BURK|nr:ChbG/HpnK family deacetylase [Caenimonas aquaedulcis]MBG9390062.1 ChbG/HpnK family deacetylase [Caenimonas aquaedulcis]